MKKIVGSQIDVWTFEALSVSVKFLDLMVKIGLSLQIWNLVVYLSVCICHDNNPRHDDDEEGETEVKPVKPFHPRSVTPPLSSTFHLSPSRLPCCISFIFVIMKYWQIQTSKDENKSHSSSVLHLSPFSSASSLSGMLYKNRETFGGNHPYHQPPQNQRFYKKPKFTLCQALVMLQC